MSTVTTLLGAIVGLIVIITLLTHGNIAFGAGPTGPSFALGYGPKN